MTKQKPKVFNVGLGAWINALFICIIVFSVFYLGTNCAILIAGIVVMLNLIYALTKNLLLENENKKLNMQQKYTQKKAKKKPKKSQKKAKKNKDEQKK